jgi:hypothetical protein
VKDRTWLVLRDEGYDIEEEEPTNEEEKVLDEKVHLAAETVDIPPEGKEIRSDRTTDTTASDIR